MRVRATNTEGNSAWTTVTGTTNRNRPGGGTPTANEAPSYTDPSTPLALEVAENTPSGQNIGNAVSATQGVEGDTLSYSLDGTYRNSFSIDRTNGQIKTRTSLNREEKSSYMVRVKVVDGRGGSAYKNVTITVTNVLGASVRTRPAEGDGDEGLGPEPQCQLECAAREHRPRSQRLRHRVSRI